MSGKAKLESQLAALEGLRQQPPEMTVGPLRAAPKQRNNYLVAKAADLVAERRIAELLPDLLTAYDRFFEDPEKSDPQCWAKNALGRALATLEMQDTDPFLRGIRHVQPEASWGGRSRFGRLAARHLRAGAGAVPRRARSGSAPPPGGAFAG